MASKKTVAQLDAEVQAFKAEVSSKDETIAQLQSGQRRLFAQLDAWQAQVEDLQSQIDALSLAPRSQNGHPRTSRPTSTASNLIPCDATTACKGHKQEKHVEIHRAQVARKKQRA